jgi:hypothetical protein
MDPPTRWQAAMVERLFPMLFAAAPNRPKVSLQHRPISSRITRMMFDAL